MINQRGITRVPEYLLPRTRTRSSQVVDYRYRGFVIVDDVREETPLFYKKVAVCLIALILGTGVGALTPLVTQTLESWFYF